MYGCSELFNSDDLGNNQKGTVMISLTDAPFPHDLVEEVNVTIDSIRFKTAGDESEFIVLEVGDPGVGITFNLLELRNGESETLGVLDVPAGEYSEIRMHVIDAKIKLTADEGEEGEVMDIKIPSGNSSGLKIKMKPSLVVNEGDEYQILLDFDVSRSFIVKGGYGNGKEKEITGFIFKPVIRAVNLALAGELSGIVEEDDDDKGFIKNAHIYVLNKEDVTDTIASGKTNDIGFYKIIGIPGGIYNVTCEKEEYESGYEENVEIIVGDETIQNFLLMKSE